MDEGKIKRFTGVDVRYEEPKHPELILEIDKKTVEESVERIFAKPIELGGLEEEETTNGEFKLATDSVAALSYLSGVSTSHRI